MNGQYIVFYISETNFYSFYDRFDRPPMRRILEDDITCNTHSITNAQMIADALNNEGLI